MFSLFIKNEKLENDNNIIGMILGRSFIRSMINITLLHQMCPSRYIKVFSCGC